MHSAKTISYAFDNWDATQRCLGVHFQIKEKKYKTQSWSSSAVEFSEFIHAKFKLINICLALVSVSVSVFGITKVHVYEMMAFSTQDGSLVQE